MSDDDSKLNQATDPSSSSSTSSSNDELLSILVSMFPDKPIDILHNALISSSNDIELACSIILSDPINAIDETIDSHRNEKGMPLTELIEMFPNIDANKIRLLYKDEKFKNADDLISELLNFELLSMEDKNEQENAEWSIKNNEPNDKVVSKKNSWNSMRANIDTIVQYTMVSKGRAREAFLNNQFNTVLAIIDIINNLHPNERKTEKILPFTTGKNHSYAGSRVQTNRGFAHPMIRTNRQANMYTSLTSDAEQHSDEDNKTEPAQFIYSLQNKKVIELQELVNGNLTLKSISPKFYRQCIIYYNGDVDKTLALALYIIKNNMANATFTTARDTVDINFIEVNYKKQPKYDSYKKNMKPSNSKPETRGASSLLNEPKGIREGTQMISRLFETYSLDFHGFLPSTAVELLKKASFRDLVGRRIIRKRNERKKKYNK